MHLIAILAILITLFIPLAHAIIWQNPDPDVSPPPRRSQAMVYDRENKVVVLFGGFGNGTHLNDTWVYDPKTNSWTKMEPPESPSPRAAVTLVYDQKHENIVLFGGFGHEHVLVFNDTWIYNYKTNIWKELKPENPPSARASYGMAYDSKRNVIVMFGGFTEYNYFKELWVYDPETNSWEHRIQSVAPSVRGSPGFVYDRKNDVFVLFSGFSEDGFYDDTWIYDPKTDTWKEMNPSVTPPPIRTRMVYDENNGLVLFFGGDIVRSGFIDEEGIPEPYSKTWAYQVNGNRWEELSTQNNPPPRALNGIAYDSHRNSLIIFGGTDSLIDEENFLGREFSDTWVLPLESITSAPDPVMLLLLIIGVATAVTVGMVYFSKSVKKK